MGGKHVFDRDEREIREMFMVDGVEFVLRNQLHQMRELHRDGSLGLKQNFQTFDKIVQIGNMREHVIAHDQIRLGSF